MNNTGRYKERERLDWSMMREIELESLLLCLGNSRSIDEVISMLGNGFEKKEWLVDE